MTTSILVIHNDYQQAGGERAAVQAQLDLLRANGHSVQVYWRDNAAIREYGVVRKALFFPRTIANRVVYREVSALVRRERPAVAHVHNVFPLISPAVYQALHAAGVPIVQTLHNFRFLCPNGLFYTGGAICERCAGGNTLPAIRWRCYRDSYALSTLYAAAIGLHRRMGTFGLIDRYLALTEFSACKFAASGLVPAERIRVLGNMLPAGLSDRPALPSDQDPYVVFLGRLVPEKGPQVALEALARVPQVRLKILGTGPLEADLRNRTAQLGLCNVEFLGFVTGEAKWHILQNALAVLVPSVWYETFGLTALESMAVGRPVVASRIGSLADLIEDGRTGLLFTPGDVEDLVQKVRRLWNEPELASTMGRVAAAHTRTRFSAESHYRSLMAIYTELRG
jgi:glycosyltransferase involved in cell wall biosynthesis